MSSDNNFNPNSVAGTVIVAAVLCLVCSLVVSAAAIGLRPRIAANKDLKIKRNVLVAAGLYQPGMSAADVDKAFESIEQVLVNLPRSPLNVEPGSVNTELGADYDARKASKDPKLSIDIPANLDLAKIKRREIAAPIYLLKGADGKVQQYIMPVYGKGLWSTLFGFLALEADARTVAGITFYEHGETPGLGGEVDNERWKALWNGKVAIDTEGVPQIDVVKGAVSADAAGGDHKIDGLSGATITSNGVEGLVNYWLGEDGFGPYLDRARANLK